MQKKLGIIFTVAFAVIVILNPVFADSEIPSWVKNNAGWWADGSIDDISFAQGIQFLMKEGLLKTNEIPDEFPLYLKSDSKNWADETISDKEYLLILENWIEDNNQESVKEIVSSSSSPYLEPSDDSQKYQSTKHGIEFSVPEGWFLQELDKMEKDSPDVVAVGSKIGGMSPVISLTVKQTNQRTLNDLITENTEKLRQEVESGNLEILSQKKIVVNGNQVHVTDAKGVFSSDGKKFDVKFKEVMIYDSEKFYTLAYSNSVNNFDSQLPRFEEAVNSFKILSKSTDTIVDNTVLLSNPSSSNVESFETYQDQIGSDSNFETGLKVGQWTKYRSMIISGGFGDMEKNVEPLEQKLKNQFQDETGLNIDNLIWIKYTVADISGSIVTFDRIAKLATNSEIRDEFRHQSFLELLDLEDKIDDEVLANVYEKKLEPKQFDLTRFEPGLSFAMPTNLEFGSKFTGTPAYGEITFASIEDIFRTGTKENLFTANKINTQTFRDGVVESTIETDTLYDVYYDRQTGLLNSRSTYFDFTNMNTYDTGWITIEMAKIDRSDNLKSTSGLKPINDKKDILERLSYLFVESANSRYLLANMVESIGEPKKTTFDIISARDGSGLGSLVLHGDDMVSSVVSSTVFSGIRNMNEADDIHIFIRNDLVPDCCYPLKTHSILLMDNIDEGHAQAEAMFDNVKVELGWVETDSVYQTEVFVQEIIFPKETRMAEQESKDLFAVNNELLFNAFPYLRVYENLVVG